jgi:hypothetical protein
MEFLHAGFSNVTKCSATHVWYSFSLATFSVSAMDVSYYHQYSQHTSHPMMEAWPLMLFIILNNNCSIMNNTFAKNIMQMG